MTRGAGPTLDPALATELRLRFAEEVLRALAWPTILVGNVLAAGAMVGYFWRRLHFSESCGSLGLFHSRRPGLGAGRVANL